MNTKKPNEVCFVEFPGYSIDEHGTIRSYWKTQIQWNNGQRSSCCIISNKSKVRKQQKDRYGYWYVNIRKNKKSKKLLIHRAIAKIFISNPDNKPFVCHVNGSKTDNSIVNLYWGTPKKNSSDSIKHGTVYCKKGEGHPKAKLSKKEVIKIRKECQGSLTFFEKTRLASLYVVSPKTIENIVYRQCWRHL